MDMQYMPHLEQAGLTRDEAALYETLVREGALPASKAARKAQVSRTLAYKVLDDLIEKGLVEKKDEKGAISHFSAVHPLQLQDIVAERVERAQNAKTSLGGVLSALISDFNAVSGEPGLRILPGIQGVADLFADVLREQQPILLVRSPNDDSFPELASLVQKQVAEQARLGISTRAITPLEPDTPQTVLAHDGARLVERRIVPREKMAVSAQILMYGNKVALTSYEEPLMTTIIDNPSIRQTFGLLFEYMWEAAQEEHERIYKQITDQSRDSAQPET